MSIKGERWHFCISSYYDNDSSNFFSNNKDNAVKIWNIFKDTVVEIKVDRISGFDKLIMVLMNKLKYRKYT